jgi:Ca-activated chloride channel family protein
MALRTENTAEGRSALGEFQSQKYEPEILARTWRLIYEPSPRGLPVKEVQESIMKESMFCGGKSAVMALLLLFSGNLVAFGQRSMSDNSNSKTHVEDQSPLVRERTELVNVTVTVTDRDGRAIPGLTARDIEVFEDKVKQKIEFYGVEDAPISVGVVFDVSGSMRNKLDQARAALKAFVEVSHQEDDFFLVGFNGRAKLVSDFCDGEELARRLNLVSAQGETALYDAVYLGIEKVQEGRHRKRALLVISDGQDNASRYSLDQLRQRLKESDVQLYSIGVDRVAMSEKAEQRRAMQGQLIMNEIAQITGGRSFFVRSAAELEETTIRVALELRRQYSIGYAPTNANSDGRWRKIQVRVNRPEGTPQRNVRAKEGYYFAP